MSDPAIEAAERALVATRGHGRSTICEIAAAREALNPLRELHSRNSENECGICAGGQGNGATWPCETAKLIYTAEELKR